MTPATIPLLALLAVAIASGAAVWAQLALVLGLALLHAAAAYSPPPERT